MVGAEGPDRKTRHDRQCVLRGLVVLVAGLLLSPPVNYFNDWVKQKVGLGPSIFWVVILGGVVVAINKFRIFWKVSGSLWITIRHYLMALWKAKLPISLMALAGVLVVVLRGVLSFLYGLQLGFLPTSIACLVTALLVLALYMFLDMQSRKNQGVLPYLILDMYGHKEKCSTVVGEEINTQIADCLLSLDDVDVICIAAVHFWHLTEHKDKLKKIRLNNPRARIYFMPQFPLTWHSRERAAELDYVDYEAGYFRRPGLSVYNSLNSLKANVRFKHNPAYFRLALWAKFKPSMQRNEHPAAAESPELSTDNWEKFFGDGCFDTRPVALWEKELLDCLVSGSSFVQQYIHGKHGYESTHEWLDLKDYAKRYANLFVWFFSHWQDRSSPTTMAELSQDRKGLANVAKSLKRLRPPLLHPLCAILRTGSEDELRTRIQSDEPQLRRLYDIIKSGIV